MIPFTTICAVDAEHLRELVAAIPTWQRHRPEIFSQPLKLCVDTAILHPYADGLHFITDAHPDVEIIPVPDYPGMSQRERMLSSLVLLAPWAVKTPFYLKLDTDVIATNTDPAWCSDQLMRTADGSNHAVFTGSPWGYTLPSTAVATLDAWGDNVHELLERPRLDLPFDPKSRSVSTPGRATSWVFFADVKWCRWASTLCRRLPVPSHDTYLWYVARRHGDPFRLHRHRRHGWAWVKGRNLEQEARKVIERTA